MQLRHSIVFLDYYVKCVYYLCIFDHNNIIVIFVQTIVRLSVLKHILLSFKTRESDDPKAFCATRANGLVEMVTNAIHEKCRIVNQVGNA